MDLSGAVRRLSTRPQVLLKLVAIKILDSLHPEQVAVFIRGSELVRLPLSEEESAGALLSRAQRSPDDFLCVCQQAVPGPLSTAGGVPPAALAFPGKSLTVTQLEAMAASDAGVSELDLEDSRSWAAAPGKRMPYAPSLSWAWAASCSTGDAPPDGSAAANSL